MRKSLVVAGLAAGVVLMSACTGPAAVRASPSPSDVGTIGVGARPGALTSPSATAATPEGSAAPSTSAELPVDDHNDGATEADLQVALDAVCADASKWWASAGNSSLGEWVDRGTGTHASAFVLDGYNDTTFAALVESDWSDFDTEAYVIKRYDSGACLMTRPVPDTSKVEVVTLTFTDVAGLAQPATLIYDRATSSRSARVSAERSIVRE